MKMTLEIECVYRVTLHWRVPETRARGEREGDWNAYYRAMERGSAFADQQLAAAGAEGVEAVENNTQSLADVSITLEGEDRAAVERVARRALFAAQNLGFSVV